MADSPDHPDMQRRILGLGDYPTSDLVTLRAIHEISEELNTLKLAVWIAAFFASVAGWAVLIYAAILIARLI